MLIDSEEQRFKTLYSKKEEMIQMKKEMNEIKKQWEMIRMKKQFKVGLASLGILLLSTGALANDGDNHSKEDNKKIKSYSRILEAQYANLEIDSKKYELDFKLKDLDTFLLMVVEVESNFFGKAPTDAEIEKAIEPILEEVNKDIQTDLKKPLRVLVEYKDVNILNKRYEN
ncbi:hypothetical protein [Psychrilyobacter atlanticus]|uniref:hypothetical protein n=1 Tax=Psychrilyobacter atlanticus TaxID=271091 RepID=UPI00040F020A|nr:hypothetical protein [Psychrilyobacter atlanticus]